MKATTHCVIVEDDDEQEKMEETTVIKKKREKKAVIPLKPWMTPDPLVLELGIDEAGRGPLFGRVYVGVAVLPKNDTFLHAQMKDSKKFHHSAKITAAAEYIKENAIAWAVAWEDETTIDTINILQATQSAMHRGIAQVLAQLTEKNLLGNHSNVLLLVDGNYFKPYPHPTKPHHYLPHQTIEGGDNAYTSIAAASILAKVARDQYIAELCELHPELATNYSIDRNKGYGAKKHLDGIRTHGITPWHRKTFGICKQPTFHIY